MHEVIDLFFSLRRAASPSNSPTLCCCCSRRFRNLNKVTNYISVSSCSLPMSSSRLRSAASLASHCLILLYNFLYSATNELKKLKVPKEHRSWISASWSLSCRRCLREPKGDEVLRFSPRLRSSSGMDASVRSSSMVSRVCEVSNSFLRMAPYCSMNCRDDSMRSLSRAERRWPVCLRKLPQSSYSRSVWVTTAAEERRWSKPDPSLADWCSLIKLNYSVNIVILNILKERLDRHQWQQDGHFEETG